MKYQITTRLFSSLFLLNVLFFSTTSLLSQSGCTDINATNFSPSAISNDGSCAYKVAFQSVNSIGVLTPKVSESSGVVLTDGYIWSHNDSGNSNQFYKIDTLTGNVVQTITVTNATNNDWEDITADADNIYLGDFGNNDGIRKNLNILKISKLQFINSNAATISVTAEFINFSYSDQVSFISSSTHNFDCESLMSISDSLYLFTKDRGDLQTRVYKLPKIAGTYVVSPYTSFNVGGLITGADYNPITNEVVLIGYLSSHKNSFLYYLSDFQNTLFFSGNKRRIELGNSINDWQTEGVTYSNSGKLFISCESSYVLSTIYQSLKSSISQASISVIENNPEISIFPNPSSDQFEIKCQDEIKSIQIIDQNGKIILNDNSLIHSNPIITTSHFTSTHGLFIIKIITSNGVYHQTIQVTHN